EDGIRDLIVTGVQTCALPILRNAEFGFLGVCVYTRMHTPRFSGQPANAGDFVFVRIPSRPIRTSCENVGTVFPLLARPSGQGLRSEERRVGKECRCGGGGGGG